MNWKPFGGPMDMARETASSIPGLDQASEPRPPAWSHGAWLVVLAACFWLQPLLEAQDSAAAVSTNAASGSPAEQIAALQLELTNAWQQVIRIVNQPVKAYVRSENTPASVFSPGWFHEGASTPDFNTVDVRQSQESPYAAHTYVTSDLNPGVVFLGRDLEFNSMTKLFYVNRSLPKHKLSEAKMLEINRLYRIIGHSRAEIARLQAPPDTDATASSQDGTNVESPAPTGLVGRIERIPREKRALYGGIAIGALIVIAVVVRLVKRRQE
jgi:hypothetical protein